MPCTVLETCTTFAGMLASVFGKLGAFGLELFSENEVVRFTSPDAAYAFSTIASSGWSYIRPMWPRSTDLRSAPIVQANPPRGETLFLSRWKVELYGAPSMPAGYM